MLLGNAVGIPGMVTFSSSAAQRLLRLRLGSSLPSIEREGEDQYLLVAIVPELRLEHPAERANCYLPSCKRGCWRLSMVKGHRCCVIGLRLRLSAHGTGDHLRPGCQRRRTCVSLAPREGCWILSFLRSTPSIETDST